MTTKKKEGMRATVFLLSFAALGAGACDNAVGVLRDDAVDEESLDYVVEETEDEAEDAAGQIAETMSEGSDDIEHGIEDANNEGSERK